MEKIDKGDLTDVIKRSIIFLSEPVSSGEGGHSNDKGQSL